MHLIVRNVSEALYVGASLIKSKGIERPSRAGTMLEYPEPFMTTYMEPRERVLFYPERDANPFFHLFESLWMLAGRNDVEWLTRYNKRMAEYSNDGRVLNGAYGYRWRKYFRYDQLEVALHRLRTYENDRRVVVTMFDAQADLKRDNMNKDIPCNTHLYLKVRDGALNMTVCCRSNDLIWGAYGANAVHFSVLLEYLALRLGVRVGTYTQLSDSFHAYTSVLGKLAGMGADYDPYLTLGYSGLHYSPEPLIQPSEDHRAFDGDIERFMEGTPAFGYHTSFFANTVEIMDAAYEMFRKKQYDIALRMIEGVKAEDWRKACREWLERRAANALSKVS